MSSISSASVKKFIFHAAKAHAKRSKVGTPRKNNLNSNPSFNLRSNLHSSVSDREDIKARIAHVKKLASSGSLSKDELKAELRSIEQKLEQNVEDESLVLVKESKSTHELEEVSEKLNRVDEKISAYHEFEKSREDRIEELEKKLLTRVNKNSKEVNLIEKKIKALDDMYNRIKSSGKVDHEKLEQIKSRMDEFRERLKKVK